MAMGCFTTWGLKFAPLGLRPFRVMVFSSMNQVDGKTGMTKAASAAATDLAIPPAFVPPMSDTPVTRSRRAAGSTYPANAVIVCLVANPKRPGTEAHRAWLAYGSEGGLPGKGVTVGEYLDPKRLATYQLTTGRPAAALAWDLHPSRKFIKLVLPE